MWRAGGGDGEQQTGFFVELDEREGAAVVGFQAHADGFGSIVFALEETALTNVANASGFGRAFGGVEDRFALFAGEAATETRDDVAHRQFVIDDGGERNVLGREQFGQGLGLIECAREAVEDEATGTTETHAAFADHVEDGGIGNQFAATHEVESGFHSGSEIALVARFGGAEDVAGGKMASVEFLVEEGGLSPFAHSRRAEKDEPPGIGDG